MTRISSPKALTQTGRPLTQVRQPAKAPPESSAPPETSERDAMEAARPSMALPDAPGASTPMVPTNRGNAGALFRARQSAPQTAAQFSGKPGPDGSPRPQVTALLATYGAPRLGRPRERLLTWAAKIHSLVASGGTPKEIAGRMMDNDLRRQVFLLEGGIKLYKKRYPELQGQMDVAKKLEDHMGWLSGARSILTLAQNKGAPKAVVDVLTHHVAEKEAALETLVAKEWTPNADGQIPAISHLIDTLSAIPWDDYQTDKTYCRKELRRRLGKIADLSERTPKDGGYNMKELQGDTGLHELRRNLRWLPIYAEALDGAVVLDPTRNPSKHYKKALTTQMADSKYIRLPNADHESDPIVISKSLYVSNMQLVLDFGSLKDSGEEIEDLAFAYLDAAKSDPSVLPPLSSDPKRTSKRDFKQARQVASELLGVAPKAFKTVRKDGQKMYDAMRDHDLIGAMRKDLKRKDLKS